jgi:hypothetical protein
MHRDEAKACEQTTSFIITLEVAENSNKAAWFEAEMHKHSI